MSNAFTGKDKVGGMQAPMVQSNKNVLKAVQHPDQHTLLHLRDVPEVVNSHFSIELKHNNQERYLEKQPRGMCVILHTDDPNISHASVQTDPIEVEFTEYERLREQLRMLIERGRQQEIQLQQYKHVAEQSVSRQYLDNACALTPSHAVVDSAISIVRETTAQELLKKVDLNSLQKTLGEKADKYSVRDATARVDKQQKFANAIMIDIDDERKRRIESMQLNEQKRQEEIARAAAALLESEQRILNTQKNVDDLMNEYAEQDSSDEDADYAAELQAAIMATGKPAAPPVTLHSSNSGSYQVNLFGKKVKKSRALMPYTGEGVDEAQKERVKQLETALSIWENAENSDKLMQTIEAHMKLALDKSVGARLKGALQQCVVNADQLRKACAILEDKMNNLEINAGDELMTKLDRKLREVEHKLMNDDNSVRGQHHKQTKQHAEVNEAVKQIKELFMSRKGNHGASNNINNISSISNSSNNSNTQNSSTNHTEAIYRNTGMHNNRGSSNNGAGRVKRLHSQSNSSNDVSAARASQNDSQRKVGDRVAEVTSVIHLLNSRQAAFKSSTASAFRILDQAVQSLHEAISRNNVVAQHGQVLLEREKKMVHKAIHAEATVYSQLTTSKKPPLSSK